MDLDLPFGVGKSTETSTLAQSQALGCYLGLCSCRWFEFGWDLLLCGLKLESFPVGCMWRKGKIKRRGGENEANVLSRLGCLQR